jgi:hypothetical protein
MARRCALRPVARTGTLGGNCGGLASPLQLVRELLKLLIGMSAYDALLRGLFALYTYIITGFGDIPTVFMLMHVRTQCTVSLSNVQDPRYLHPMDAQGPPGSLYGAYTNPMNDLERQMDSVNLGRPQNASMGKYNCKQMVTHTLRPPLLILAV